MRYSKTEELFEKLCGWLVSLLVQTLGSRLESIMLNIPSYNAIP